MNDRIKLAEAMGWKPLAGEWDLKSDPKAWEGPDIIGNYDDLPDPFTDANDDYAVLEFMRSFDDDTDTGLFPAFCGALHELIILRRDPTANPDSYGIDVKDFCSDHQIGDYARAALKVIK